VASDRSVKVIVGGAAALLLAVGVYVLTRQDEDAAPPAASLSSIVKEAAQPVALPSVPPLAAEPLATPDAIAADRDGGRASGAASAVSPRALSDVGSPIRLTGRIVDERGAPVADAEVIHLPSPAAVKALGRKFIPFGPRFPWVDFLRTTSARDGRFALASFDLPRPEAPTRPPLLDGAVYAAAAEAAPVPSLVVRHPDHAATLHVCFPYREGDLDVGDIILPPGATIVGRLLDEDGAPLAGGRIGVSSLNERLDEPNYADWMVVCEVISAISGEDGRFELGSIWAGAATLSISATGFVPLELSAPSEIGAVTDAGDITLARGTTIAGLVLDAQARPVAGATVKARSSELDLTEGATDSAAYEFAIIVRSSNAHEVEVRTDEQGAFELLTLNRERYIVLVGKDGYEPAKLSDVPVGTRDARATLLPRASALVTVVDARTRAPVAGASGTGRRMMGGNPLRVRDQYTTLDVIAGEAAVLASVATVDPEAAPEPALPAASQGLLLVRGLGLARNLLIVSAAGYATTEVELPPVSPGAQVLHEVALETESSISGLVVAADRTPIALAAIEVGGPVPPTHFAKPRHESAGEDGRFRIGGLAAGEWKLTASAAGFARGEPHVVRVAARQALEGLELTLPAGARITGVVLARDGTPQAGHPVQAVHTSVAATPHLVEVTATGTTHRTDPTARARNYTARADEAGRFALEPLPAGSFEVTAEPGGQAMIELPAGGAADVVLQLRQPPAIRGRVLDGDGPVAGAEVECHLYSESSKGWVDGAHAITSATGEYQLTLSQSGDCLLRAEHDGARAAMRRVTATWDVPVFQDLAFGAERLAGRVVNATSGAAVPGASVSFRDETAQERDGLGPQLTHFYLSSAETGADGRFETRRLQPGRHTVEVRKKGYVSATQRKVEVPSREEELRFELVAGATLKGTVRATNGAVLSSDFSVRVRIDGAVLADGAPFEKSSSVNPDGSFERRDLPAGAGVLQLLRFAGKSAAPGDGWEVLTEKSCALVAGQTTTAEFLVAP
jgi:hypothetical protein